MIKMKSTPKIENTESYFTFSETLEYDLNFLQGMNDLISCYGRIKMFHLKSKSYFFNTELLASAAQTLRSIKLCCSIGSFSDANALVRKYRDDLLLYIYFLDVISNRKNFNKEDVQNLNLTNADDFVNSFMNVRLNLDCTDDESALEGWITNTLNDLPRKQRFKISFENYMLTFKQNPSIKEILSKYGLENYWEELRSKLNNYVHNNGLNYANQNNTKFGNKNIDALLEDVNIRVSYITTVFLILLIMTDASLISSTDMIDHLDLGLTPPEESQYWIAGFIQKYIDEKVVALHPELKTFLKDNNAYGMEIN